MEKAIEVKNLCKNYRVYDSKSSRIRNIINPFAKKEVKEFKALTDVSFHVNKGEIVGIIGNNGAGKSTLLKILTGVSFPSSGEVNVNGRVSSLLELGTGFNPELTGEENIYFNGSLMGLTQDEIDKVKDNIIEFADIGEFINQPVKSYSSGMYARLAFAVAININPDILIVDEILSVGDVGFQKKCMDKFNEFKEAGKTVLYEKYYDKLMKSDDEEELETGKFVELINVEILDDKKVYKKGESIEFLVEYEVFNPSVKNAGITIEMRKAYREPCEYRNADQFIFSVNSNVDEFTIPWKKGRNKITFKIDSLDVKEGIYYLDAIFSESQNLVALETQEDVVSFEVKNEGESEGFVFLDSTWT